jgi:hypothetical protein
MDDNTAMLAAAALPFCVMIILILIAAIMHLITKGPK